MRQSFARLRLHEGFLATLEELQVFDPHEAVDLFNEFSRAILEQPRTGREQAMSAVGAVTGELVLRRADRDVEVLQLQLPARRPIRLWREDGLPLPLRLALVR